MVSLGSFRILQLPHTVFLPSKKKNNPAYWSLCYYYNTLPGSGSEHVAEEQWIHAEKGGARELQMLQRGAVLLDAPQHRLQVATAVVAAQRHLTNQSTGVKELTINQSNNGSKMTINQP